MVPNRTVIAFDVQNKRQLYKKSEQHLATSLATAVDMSSEILCQQILAFLYEDYIWSHLSM